jgi:hypothetical protein
MITLPTTPVRTRLEAAARPAPRRRLLRAVAAELHGSILLIVLCVVAVLAYGRFG